MSDNIYTSDINEQSAAVALNTVLWRLAVATGLARKGDSPVELSPNIVLLEAERQLERRWQMLEGGVRE
jgi:hypothetical protein